MPGPAEEARTGHGMGDADSRLRKRKKCCIVSHSVAMELRVGGSPYRSDVHCCARLSMLQRIAALREPWQRLDRSCQTRCILLHFVASDRDPGPAARIVSDVHPCACLCLLRGLDPHGETRLADLR